MTIDDLVKRAHANSVAKGWWQGDSFNIPEKLALIHSEVSEALEEYRHDPSLPRRSTAAGKPEGFASEMADVVIRVADLCGKLDIPLEDEIKLKMAFNATRPHRHGGKTC